MNQKPKKKRRRAALNMPMCVIERLGDKVYGPNDPFPYVIKDVGKNLAELFGKEVLRQLAARQQQLKENLSELTANEKPSKRD
jgi:hypothetical protein